MYSPLRRRPTGLARKLVNGEWSRGCRTEWTLSNNYNAEDHSPIRISREATMIDRRELALELDALMDAEAVAFLASVPHGSHLTDDGPLDEAYYLRHRIETVKRIRITARTDAIALARMVEEDYAA